MGYCENRPPYYITAYGMACKAGFVGTVEEWLDSLTAFYMAQQAGYVGTKEEWIKKLVDPLPLFSVGEVITLDGGLMATVTITGTKEKPILNFGIPRGVGMVDAMPLVGGTMKGPIDMGNYGIDGLPEPSGETCAVNKKYADAIKEIADDAMDKLVEKLSLSGGTMTGAVNMNGKRLYNIKTPTDDKDAAPKDYVDNAEKKAKEYTDGKHLPLSAVLTTAWIGDAAPYTQSVSLKGILSTDHPHVMPVYSEDLETARAQREAWSMVSDANTADGSIIFTCFEDKPETAINVQIEVNR